MENGRMPSVSLVYDRKKTATRTKAAVVEIRISYDYRKKYISTGVNSAKGMAQRHGDGSA